MKIHFHVPPVSHRLHGWKRVACWLTHALRSTLVLEIGRNSAA